MVNFCETIIQTERVTGALVKEGSILKKIILFGPTQFLLFDGLPNDQVLTTNL